MRSSRGGLLSLFLVGGYFAWRNRFRIQQFLESRGIDVPLSTNNLGDTLRSGVAKLSGSLENIERKSTKNIPSVSKTG